MKSAHWQLASRIVPEALALPIAKREAYLDQACGDNHELRREVDALLAADPDEAAFIESPALELMKEPPSVVKVGDRIGAYRLTQELGSGGMGVVYLAARADQRFEHQVAVKVLRKSMRAEQNRFDQEIQILARLNHPSIAKLHDGGQTEDGHPYFLMEYVEGQPIDAYCHDRNLSVPTILALFREVCAAVHYAHQNLVVHRDLKPSNILVTEAGEPKLLDFGVAKLLESDTAPSALAGAQAGRPMTLEYASPEQVNDQAITTGSDIYSLGVILYRLLTGHHPYRLQNRSEEGIRQAISEERPELPSAAAARSHRSRSPGSSTAASEFRRAHRRHGRDLDAIVLMALRKKVRHRYSSAEQFSADLQRYVQQLPVLAQEDRFLYRTGKFMQRNKMWVGLVAAIVLLVVGFTTKLYSEQKETARQKERAERVSEFLADLFKRSDPHIVNGEEYSARDMLDQGARKIDQELQTEPAIQIELLGTMALSYYNLGLYNSATELYNKQFEVRMITGSKSAELGDSLASLAVSHYKAGAYEESKVAYKRAIDLFDNQSDAESLSHAFNGLALLYKTLGEYSKAETLYLRALDIRQRLLGEESSEVATTWNNLAVLYNTQGRYVEAEATYRHTLKIKEKLFGTEHPKVATTLKNLAIPCKAQGYFDEADELLSRALAIEEKALGDQHPSVAVTLNNLGVLKYEQGDYSAAESLHDRALAIREKYFDSRHRRIAESLHNLAAVYLKQGKLQSARDYLERALDIQKGSLGEQHREVALTVRALGDVYQATGDLSKAEEFYRRSLLIQEQNLDPKNLNLVPALLSLGELLHKRGDIQEAKEAYDHAIAIHTKVFGAEHPTVLANIKIYRTLFGDQE